MPPNVHQFGNDLERGRKEHSFTPPVMTQWAVPIDDTNTVKFIYRHIPDDIDDLSEIYDFGQTLDRAYEDRQRIPGDYDAQVGQRPIAIHSLEHLATTDRGVIMFRNMVRRELRAAKAGQDLKWPSGGGDVIRTYANDTVVRIPPAPTPEEDKKLLSETGLRLAKEYMEGLSQP